MADWQAEFARDFREMRAAASALPGAVTRRVEPALLHVREAFVAEDALERLGDRMLHAWCVVERERLRQRGAGAPAPGAAAVEGRWVSERELRLVLPEYPPRYPVSFRGRYGVTAFEQAGGRWRRLVEAAMAAAGRPSGPWARAAVRLTYRLPATAPRDPDGYSVRFVLNGLVNCGVLADDDGRCVRHCALTSETAAPGALGTVVRVRRLA